MMAGFDISVVFSLSMRKFKVIMSPVGKGGWRDLLVPDFYIYFLEPTTIRAYLGNKVFLRGGRGGGW